MRVLITFKESGAESETLNASEVARLAAASIWAYGIESGGRVIWDGAGRDVGAWEVVDA